MEQHRITEILVCGGLDLVEGREAVVEPQRHILPPHRHETHLVDRRDLRQRQRDRFDGIRFLRNGTVKAECALLRRNWQPERCDHVDEVRASPRQRRIA